jgi:hypothetical protein
MSCTHLLSEEQLALLEKDGFLIVNDFFTPDELLPVLKGAQTLPPPQYWQICSTRPFFCFLSSSAEVEERVDRLAQRLYAAGKIQHLHADADVFHRLTLLEQEFKGASGTDLFSFPRCHRLSHEAFRYSFLTRYSLLHLYSAHSHLGGDGHRAGQDLVAPSPP